MARARSIRCASPSAEPAMSSRVPTATSAGMVRRARSSRLTSVRDVLIQAASASRSLLVCSAKAEHAAALVAHIFERISPQGRRDRIPVAYTVNHAEAEAAEYHRVDEVRPREREKRRDSRSHRVAHYMRRTNIERIEQSPRIRRHDFRVIGFRIMRLVGLAMSAIVERDHPETCLIKRLEPAGKHPVHMGGGCKAVNQQNRETVRISRLVPRDFDVSGRETSGLQPIQIHVKTLSVPT